jgi:hypothetical protein
MISILTFQTIRNYFKKVQVQESSTNASCCVYKCVCVCARAHPSIYIYIKLSTQQISNQLITTFVSIEFINYVKIMRHVSAHLEP